MEQRCLKHGIKFVRIKPRKTWKELYAKYDMPRKFVRWCNNMYKLDCKRQLNDWIKSQNYRPIAYIGFCADEVKRFNYEVGTDWNIQEECYPLAEEGIDEDQIWQWAKNVPMFHNWYRHFKRQGCMFCPMLTVKQQAWMYLNYPDKYDELIGYIKEWEAKYNSYYYEKPLEKHLARIKGKWAEQIKKEEAEFEQNKDMIYDIETGCVGLTMVQTN